MKISLTDIIVALKGFNNFIYSLLGKYHFLIPQLTLGFIYGGFLSFLVITFGRYFLNIFLYGGAVVACLYYFKILSFDVKALYDSLGISPKTDFLPLVQQFIERYPIEIISAIFFFIFFYFLSKRYN